MIDYSVRIYLVPFVFSSADLSVSRAYIMAFPSVRPSVERVACNSGNMACFYDSEFCTTVQDIGPYFNCERKLCRWKIVDVIIVFVKNCSSNHVFVREGLHFGCLIFNTCIIGVMVM